MVPGNDDASRAVSLYCDLIAKAAIDGISRAQGERGRGPRRAGAPIVEDLPKPVEKSLGFEPLPGPRGVADDLKKLPGVSPAIEKQLQDLGIFHYSQIAELSPEAAHNVGEEVGLPGRVQGWIAKAKELTSRINRRARIRPAPRLAAEMDFDDGKRNSLKWSRTCASKPARA